MRLPEKLLREINRVARLVISKLSFVVSGADADKLTVTKNGSTITFSLDLGDIGGGDPVEFQASGTHIQWRVVGDPTWINLVALADISGTDGTNGTNGTDGREVEMQLGSGFLSYRYVGDVTWINIATQAAITGPTGAAGTNGNDGAAATVSVGTVTTGAAGSSVTFTNVGTSSAAVFDVTIPRGDTGATGGVGPAGSTGPAGSINGTGDWVNLTFYDKNSVVTNNGSSYYALSDHTGSSTDEPGVGVNTDTYWGLLAAKGATGDAGAPGLDSAAPMGVPFPFAGFRLPTNYLWCNGDLYSGAASGDYTDLLHEIGFAYGNNTVSKAVTITFGSTSVGITGHGLSVGDGISLGAYNERMGQVDTHGCVAECIPMWVESVIDADTITLSETPGGAAKFPTMSSVSGTIDIYTQFGMPDSRGVVFAGRDSMGGGPASRVNDFDADFLGTIVGSETHLLTGQESGVQDHDHGIHASQNTRASGGGNAMTNFAGSDVTGDTDLSGNIDAVSEHNNIQPTTFCNYIIRYQ